ncbi:hypothetical protein SDC9_84490 [bioreactor metagenome]|uniref:Uncharacterized protein n=1 Tax=bioreactor metagenome TaxID=1076179 RepID=A0A644ZD99_9ZZZZ
MVVEHLHNCAAGLIGLQPHRSEQVLDVRVLVQQVTDRTLDQHLPGQDRDQPRSSESSASSVHEPDAAQITGRKTLVDLGLPDAVRTQSRRHRKPQEIPDQGIGVMLLDDRPRQRKRTLSGNTINRNDSGKLIHVPDMVVKHLALSLRNDIAFGHHDNVGKTQHRSEFIGGIDARKIVDDANRQNIAHMRRAAAAQTRRLADQHVEALLPAPLNRLLDVRDEEMVRAQVAGQPHLHRHVVTTV